MSDLGSRIKALITLPFVAASFYAQQVYGQQIVPSRLQPSPTYYRDLMCKSEADIIARKLSNQANQSADYIESTVGTGGSHIGFLAHCIHEHLEEKFVGKYAVEVKIHNADVRFKFTKVE